MSKISLPPRHVNQVPNSAYFNAIYELLGIPARIEKGHPLMSAQAWLIESALEIKPKTIPGDPYDQTCDRIEAALREWEYIE